MTTIITRTTIRIVVPIVLIVSTLLLLQGHKLPGGGFIGGVLTTTALVLVYVGYGLDYVEVGVLDREVESGSGISERRIVTAYQRIFVLGLGLVVSSGAAGLLFREPFLSQTFVILHDVPLYHEVELASALIFDLGIYCVVVGGLLTIVSVVGAE